MTDQEMERKLKNAIERSAPDGLERLLSAVDNGKGAIKMEKTNHLKKKNRWIGLVAAILAVALIGGAGGVYYSRNVAVATVVSLDVNPSIELRVNASQRVLKCLALNGEAGEILSSMSGGADLEGAKLDVAVNAIVGAIVRAGYLDSLSSAILISVEDRDQSRGARLQAELVATVDGVLKTASNSAGVMSQSVTGGRELDKQAQENNISSGKAALVNQVLDLNSSLDFAELSKLSVEELRDLIHIGAPAMLIGRDAAARIAEESAGVSGIDDYLTQFTQVDPEIDDPVPNYEVEINWGGKEYKYEIDAFTGEILTSRVPPEALPDQAVTTEDEAFNAAAEYFSQQHPELIGNFLNIESRYDAQDGHFEVEFWCRGWEFEYEVDGQTGKVLREETDYRYTTPTQTDTPSTPDQPDTPTQPTQPDTPSQPTQPDTPAQPTQPDTPSKPAQTGDIGAEAAKAAALKDAGLSAAEVTFLHAKADYEDGRPVYDVDFYTDTNEYDYEIDAATGAILKGEVEKRPGAVTPPATDPGSTGDIGEAAAKDAALKRAGITAAVDWIRVEHDYDNGRHYYELEFECDGTVYDCDVDAATGDVVKFESEKCDNVLHNHNQAGSGQPQSGDIGAQAAKDAALRHAGLSESQVTRLKCEKDRDDGRTVYEVEFDSNGWEYEYKIDAATGAVLEHERDR